jgi:hypothetical protein
MPRKMLVNKSILRGIAFRNTLTTKSLSTVPVLSPRTAVAAMQALFSPALSVSIPS